MRPAAARPAGRRPRPCCRSGRASAPPAGRGLRKTRPPAERQAVTVGETWWSAERAAAEDWCRERAGVPRILILLWMAAILVYLWQDPPQRGLFDWPNLFSGINLGIHELGHVICSPLGVFVAVLG